MHSRKNGLAVTLLAVVAAACGGGAPSTSGPVPTAGSSTARHVVLVTIDTLRADRVGAYGYAAAKTPAIDALAAAGLRVGQAFATAPVTLTSHASLLTGLYPPAHGARHNGVALAPGVPTLATILKAQGFATGAFVGAFPLERRFGLAAGFDVYGDRLPRLENGKPADERPGEDVVDEALAWRKGTGAARTFLWVHLFEPHAPYGNPTDGRPIAARYDDDIAEADRQVGRLVAGLGSDRDVTLVVVAADHGEAFGEHGEIGHSLFVYDTTLRVPLVLQGPGVAPGTMPGPVSLVDVAPTVLGLLGVAAPAMDGRAFAGATAVAHDPSRVLYADTEAPWRDFGWSPLRSVRTGGLKFIQAPTPELYDVAQDAGETANLLPARASDLAPLRAALAEAVRDRVPASADTSPVDADARRRLQALGYLGGAGPSGRAPTIDPKDRRDEAARIAEITAGELTGLARERALRALAANDPGNPQVRMRLGFALVERGECAEAVPHFRAAIASPVASVDAHLGLAECLVEAGKVPEALAVLGQAAQAEPGNPVVLANQGVLLSDRGQPAKAIPLLERALGLDGDLYQARFFLAIAYARTGDRTNAVRHAQTLLGQLPPGAPQAPEVRRLIDALR